MPAKGSDVTGNLRDVMKESIRRRSYVRSRAVGFGSSRRCSTGAISRPRPEGAPRRMDARRRDGDRVIDGIPVRHDVAMTGEITLRDACCRSAA